MYDEFGRIDDQAWAAVANRKESEAFREGFAWGIRHSNSNRAYCLVW